jgi:hypothetical protein
MKNYTLTGGLILGFLAIIITGITYFMGVDAMLSAWNLLFRFLLFTGLYLFFGFRYRKMNGGYLIYKDAFALLFFISVISTVLSGLFDILLYHVINPGLLETLQDAMVKKMVATWQWMGLPQDKIDEQISKMQAGPSQFTVGIQIRGIAISFIWCAALAAILGLIIRKNPPPFDNVIDQTPS